MGEKLRLDSHHEKGPKMEKEKKEILENFLNDEKDFPFSVTRDIWQKIAQIFLNSAFSAKEPNEINEQVDKKGPKGILMWPKLRKPTTFGHYFRSVTWIYRDRFRRGRTFGGVTGQIKLGHFT